MKATRSALPNAQSAGEMLRVSRPAAPACRALSKWTQDTIFSPLVQRL
jgi:hypothetical protein